MVVVNETECEELTGIYPSDDASCRLAMEKFLARGVRCSVITLGERGLIWRRGTERGAVPAPPIVAIDTTGAGDAFASGFLSQWSRGKSLRESIIFASANSTSVVMKIGAKAGILRRGVKLHEMPISEKPVDAREAN